MNTFGRVGEADRKGGSIGDGCSVCGGGLGGSGLIVTGDEGRSTNVVVGGVGVVRTAEEGSQETGVVTDGGWARDGGDSSKLLVAGEADAVTLLGCH